jgi:hypothetical protein
MIKCTGNRLMAFLASIIPLLLKREGVAGAAVTVVKDGRIFFARGLGAPGRGKTLTGSAPTSYVVVRLLNPATAR